MAYTLYYSPAACSLAVHATLNAVGAKFELIKASDASDYRALNVLGQVPVLVEDGAILKESAAIMLHLIEKHHHPLMPKEGEARQHALQWLLFFNSTMHQTHGAYFLITGNIADKQSLVPVRELLSKRIAKLWRSVEAELKDDFIGGKEPCAADILMAVIANWQQAIDPKPAIGEKVIAACRRIAALPYFAKALTTEGITYSL